MVFMNTAAKIEYRAIGNKVANTLHTSSEKSVMCAMLRFAARGACIQESIMSVDSGWNVREFLMSLLEHEVSTTYRSWCAKTTDSHQNPDTLLRDLCEMKKYRGRRSKSYHLQIVFVVGMLARHPEMKV